MNELLQQIHRLNEQAWSDRNKDVRLSLKMAQQAQALLLNVPGPNTRELALSLRTQGYCLEHLSRFDEALTAAVRAMELASQVGDMRLIAAIDNVLGNIYWRLADYSSALDHFMHGLRLTQVEPDPELETFLFQGLGALHHDMRDYEEALKYFKRSLEMPVEESNISRAIGLNNIAYTLHEMKRDQEALPYALQALERFERAPFSVGRLAALHTLGSIYFETGDIARSSHYFEEAFQAASNQQDHLQTINALFGISQIQQVRGELDAARENLLRILKIAKDIRSLVSECNAHEMLAKLYKRLGQYQQALEHYETFHNLHVQIFNEESERRLHNTQMLLEVETIRKQVNLYRSLAATDALTGLLSRREFFEMGEKVIAQVRHRHAPVSLLMVDLDYFKLINDQYGHAVGDQVLSMIARRLKNTLRQDDLAGRYGGDEFVILMPDIALPACQKIAERCRKVIAEEPVEVDDLSLTMNISIGLAVLDTDSSLTLEDLIQHADQALLFAKKNGRNRIISSGTL
jgi:diguanylate cyclase (GGDEF)-like protein